MCCEVLIRPATARDERARADLVRRGIMLHQTEAFLLYFFEEITFECIVLCCAVLIIFFGLAPMHCVLVLPAAAVVVAGLVHFSHLQLVERHVQKMRSEVFGLVGEVREPPPQPPRRVRVAASEDALLDKPAYSQVVGTASLAERCAGDGGWLLHDLAVHPDWQRRGIGAALAAAAGRGGAGGGAGGGGASGAGAGGAPRVHAVLSCVQGAARELLQKLQWECVGSYHRPLGAGLSLRLVHLAAPAPPTVSHPTPTYTPPTTTNTYNIQDSVILME